MNRIFCLILCLQLICSSTEPLLAADQHQILEMLDKPQVSWDQTGSLPRSSSPPGKTAWLTFFQSEASFKAQKIREAVLLEDTLVKQLAASDIDWIDHLLINYQLALLKFDQESFEDANLLFHQLLQKARTHHLRYFTALLLAQIGRTYEYRHNRGASSLAEGHFKQALESLPSTDRGFVQGICWLGLARIDRLKGRFTHALVKAKDATRIFKTLSAGNWLAESLKRTAAIELAMGRHAEALRHIRESRQTFAPDRESALMELDRMEAEIQLVQGNAEQALLLLERHKAASKRLKLSHVNNQNEAMKVSMGLELEQERTRLLRTKAEIQKQNLQLQELAMQHKVQATILYLAISLAIAVLIMALFFSAFRIWRRNSEIHEINQFISAKVLQRFLPPALVHDILSGRYQLDDKPQVRLVTILSIDICNFTAATERLGPERIATLLDQFMVEMTEIIFANEGTIDKFIGDAIVVIFGAPTPMDAAVQIRHAESCAFAMLEKLAQLNVIWEGQFQWQVNVRIGLHQGQGVVGSFGSERRSDYTVMGASVDIARKLDNFAEPNQILASASICGFLTAGTYEPIGVMPLPGSSQVLEYFALTAKQVQEQQIA